MFHGQLIVNSNVSVCSKYSLPCRHRCWHAISWGSIYHNPAPICPWIIQLSHWPFPKGYLCWKLHCSAFEDRCYFTKIQSKHTGNFLSCWVSERGTGYLQLLSPILIKFSKDSLFLQEALPLVTDFITTCVRDKLTSPVVTSPV